LRFLVAGGVAAGANVGSRFLFSALLPFEWAIVLAYLVGMLVAFLLMRGQVFHAGSGALLPQLLKFSFVNLLAVLQTLLVSLFLANYALDRFVELEPPVREAIAHAVGVAVPVFTSYFGHLRLTFR
jgi:putative flippase GtrA